jgi:hypothetical protein
VELVAGEFDREDVVLLLAEDRVEQGDADVADGRRAQARRLQDGGEHLDGRGLAVGAGDREPGRRFPAVQFPQPPGEFDVAPDRNAGSGGRCEQRLVRLPAGRGHDEVGAFRQGRAVTEAHGDTERLQVRGLRPGPFVVAVVDDRDERSEAVQDLGRRDSRYAEAGDGDVPALPVGHFLAAHPA